MRKGFILNCLYNQDMGREKVSAAEGLKLRYLVNDSLFQGIGVSKPQHLVLD